MTTRAEMMAGAEEFWKSRDTRSQLAISDANARADKAESELFALGVQVQALKERLKLATDAVEKLREFRSSMTWLTDDDGQVRALRVINSMDLNAVDRAAGYALAAFDAVPGDVGAPSPDCPREPACPTVGFHAADECTPAPKMTDDEANDLATRLAAAIAERNHLLDEVERVGLIADAAEALARSRLDDVNFAWASCHDGQCRACDKCCDAAQQMVAEMRAKVDHVLDNLDALHAIGGMTAIRDGVKRIKVG
jgi:hypothetical protein